MSDRQLTGTRVRSRRLERGIKQAELARAVGISASYLNLIEHNRRRIGGKLLSDIARQLTVDPDMLVDGTAAAVLAPLTEAAAEFRSAAPEAARAEELVARFPGWVALIGAQHDRISQLEARVRMLTDRLTHDPQVASSLHDVISMVTAIRSTASILVESEDLDRDWTSRFHRNIDADSRRLSESSQALMGYLDINADTGGQAQSPLEVAEAFWVGRGFHFPELEGEGENESTVGTVGTADLSRIHDPLAIDITQGWLDQYRRDAIRLPLEKFGAAARDAGYDPGRLARAFDQPMDVVLRRIASLPEGEDHPAFGLAICDQAGVVVFQKPVMEFNLPRAGSGCPIWPMYQALPQPGRPLRRTVSLPGSGRTVFDCIAVSYDHAPASFEGAQRVISTMLVRPSTPDQDTDITTVGPGCRVCPIEGCASRRQPSVLTDV